MRRVLGIALVIAGLAARGLPSAEATPVFTFGPDETTTFSVTDGGVTATFTSPTAETQFATGPGFGGFTGYILVDSGISPDLNIPLDIGFSGPTDFLSFYYMTDGPGTITMDAFDDGTPVGSVTDTGVLPSGEPYPQGLIEMSGVNFDSVVISSTAPAFALANDDTNFDIPADVPEPGTLGLLAVGLIGVIAIRRALPASGRGAPRECIAA